MPTDLYELTLPDGVDPALLYARPDVEQFVHESVKMLGGVVSWSL